MAVARSFPHDPKRSDAVVEYWSIGAFSTPTLHYSIAPGRQFSTRGRMSEPMFSAQWLGQLPRGYGQKTADNSPSPRGSEWGARPPRALPTAPSPLARWDAGKVLDRSR